MIRHSAKAIENEELSAQYFSSLSHSMWCPVRTILTAGCGTNRGVVGPVVGVGPVQDLDFPQILVSCGLYKYIHAYRTQMGSHILEDVFSP